MVKSVYDPSGPTNNYMYNLISRVLSKTGNEIVLANDQSGADLWFL